ncbi:hypothetical protein VNO77_34400 [Canavalia gladiata]|uniref:Uncharacterized protein n=1 Tax=Canavalia gladiata TaxID=3824 RepID=A0AAN9KE85_CANGL
MYHQDQGQDEGGGVSNCLRTMSMGKDAKTLHEDAWVSQKGMGVDRVVGESPRHSSESNRLEGVLSSRCPSVKGVTIYLPMTKSQKQQEARARFRKKGGAFSAKSLGMISTAYG